MDARRSASPPARRVESPPGETNVYRYQPRGVGVVIAPWNFPLAILTGMVTAALVTGNCVVFKPAEQTPGVALRLVEMLLEAGVPPGALAFLPGVGEEIGPTLVEHPTTAFIAFTGSKAVGLSLIAAAAVHRPGQQHVKRVIAEMGGKNAIVVDADADLDEAVPAIVASAFGYAGQKCSAAARVIAVGAVYEELLERLIGATALVPVGHARELSTVVGPLIDEDAYQRVTAYTRGRGRGVSARGRAGRRLVRGSDDHRLAETRGHGSRARRSSGRCWSSSARTTSSTPSRSRTTPTTRSRAASSRARR